MFGAQYSWRDLPPVTKNLIIINVLVFAAASLVQFQIEGMTLYEYLILYYWKTPYFRPVQLLTHMFHHGGFMHIAFNMWGLFLLGPSVEMSLGHKRFLIFYLACGFGSAALHLGVTYFADTFGFGTPGMAVLGASGALYGVIGAFGRIAPDAQLALIFPPIRFKAKTLVYFLLGMESTLGLAQVFMNVHWLPFAHFAHLGGLVTGLALMAFWAKRRN